MGKPTGFLELKRKKHANRDVAERVRDFLDVSVRSDVVTLREQSSRCMDCGVAFCHQGCPLGNLIPEWNDLVYRERWTEALDALHATNNFPEFTGKLCPAPCEAACVLGIIDDAVSIKDVELEIIERGFDDGRISPQVAEDQSGKRVAVIGSGPAGLACAQQLARLGHTVVVLERSDRIGGLLRYGIPDFKMDKSWLDRRLAQMSAEGVEFRTQVDVGLSTTGGALLAEFDAICVATGAAQPRMLEVPGSDAAGVYLAMNYLEQQNRIVAGDSISDVTRIDARGKRVVILGGGDTGADCLGTAHRQGAASVTQLEIAPRPPDARDAHRDPWPQWPVIFRVSPAHEEGGERVFAQMTTRVLTEAGRVTGIETQHVERDAKGAFAAVPGTERVIDCDLLLLAMGFTGPAPSPVYAQLGVTCDASGRVIADVRGRTSVPNVFAAGDVRRGASLIVWAIAEGRAMAASAAEYLLANSSGVAIER